MSALHVKLIATLSFLLLSKYTHIDNRLLRISEPMSSNATVNSGILIQPALLRALTPTVFNVLCSGSMGILRFSIFSMLLVVVTCASECGGVIVISE